MTQTLEDFVAVRGRFHRSISLAADWGTAEAMSEYLATDTVVELASGILEELDNEIAARAWSITGPYGSGKSAFALFLCEILAKAHPSHRAAQVLRRRHDLGSRRFLPVLASAERGPLAPVLLRSLTNASGGAGRRGVGAPPDGARVVKALEQTAVRARQRRYSGLVVVVDELGKFLEYAALHPQEADVFLLQQLAEAATRSAVPIILVTILHSGFSDYLPATEEVRRSEWQKVQGRFRDIPFQLPSHQVLQLVASAIDARLPDALTRVWRGELDAFLAARVQPAAGGNWAGVLQGCFPLHPLTSILLWPLFRSKGAQNERSLFSFLTSREPHGLREYLAGTAVASAETPLYRPSHLFDYIATSLGLGAFRGDQARRWALADQALARLPADAPAASADVIKSITLLSLYGAQVGVTASPALLALAVGRSRDAEGACKYLSKASLVVYRSHSDSFALWEGSDFDLESAHEHALQRLRGSGSMAQRLQRVLQVRPFVPRAHYVRTGTLRWFEVGLVSGSEDLAAFLQSARDCDGMVAFVVPGADTIERPTGHEVLEALVAEADRPVILAFPKDVAGIEQALDDLEAWMWVATYSIELAGDPVARQEVRSRVTAARDRLESLVGAVLGLPGLVMEASRCRWRYDGSSARPATGRAFQEWLSGICDEVYQRAPQLRNELLNRSVLSSAAAKARRNLIERMLASSALERLGIEGWPPEAAMYESMLRAPGMHRQHTSTWTLGRPKGDWAPAWDATVEFARSSGNARRTVSELFGILKAPPYGLKDGPLPVLLCGVLCSLGDEVALYEDGVFLPELRIEAFERLLRRPESFELKHQALSGAQMKLVRALGRALARSSPTDELPGEDRNTVALVRKLIVSVGGMPPYARQTRRGLSPEAVRVREQLLSAADPAKLLFEDLPTACGVELSARSVDEFVEVLTRCMSEITGSYTGLLDQIESMLRGAFGLSSELLLAERQMRQIAEPLTQIAAEPRLQVFVREAARDHGGRDFRESIGRAVNGGLPPTHWKDSDVPAFHLRLAELRSDVVRLEELAAEMRRSGAPRVVRLGLLEGTGSELHEVVALRGGTDAEVEALVKGLADVLWQSAEDSADARRIRLEALGRVAADLLADVHQEAQP